MSQGEITTGVRSILSRPSVYELFSRVIGSHQARTRLIRDHLQIPAGSRVLDVGCGPGDLLAYLGDVDYVGIDISPSYLNRARKRFADRRAVFLVGDAAAVPADLGAFDVAVATGVLHHLSNEQVRAMVAGVAARLKPSGRFVCVENAFVPGQHPVARAIIARDRGQHVRSPEGYVELTSSSFGSASITVRHDLLRVPYTHCIIDLQNPRAS